MTDSEKLDLLLSEMQSVKQKITGIELHLENVTDKNIMLLAENYCNLTKKLDDNNKITDNEIAYQIKVNYLMSDVEKLKQEISELKNKIA